jgi:hypothetical protein
MNTIQSNTKKLAAVYSDANHLARGSRKPRMETTKGEKAGVSNPWGDEKMYADAVHKLTRKVTARASGTYRARWTTMV